VLLISRLLLALALCLISATPFAADKDSPAGRVAKVNGIELHYQEQGAGKPLVLLHGFGGCGQNWEPFLRQLSAKHRLIIVDMRGHGSSTNPEKTFTHRQSARDVFALLDQLDIDRFSAMGVSSGGMTLLHMATSQPKRVESMVLIGASYQFPEQARSILREATTENIPAEVQEMYRQCATRGDEQVRELAAQFNAFHKSQDDMNFTAADLSKILARTLIVHGDRDPFFPVEIPVFMYRAIPKASLWIVPDGDHVPIYDPAVPFTATALRFLDNASPK
jgi:pimeloyl-ACP methyl ester carboxylesterase